MSPGPSYVSLSILCGQGLLLMDYTEHNLDLHEALNDDECEANLPSGHKFYISLVPPSSPQANLSTPIKSGHLLPRRGSSKPYQAVSQSDRVSPYNKGVGSISHHTGRADWAMGYKSAGRGRIATEGNAMETKQNESELSKGEISASAVFGNTSCGRSAAGGAKRIQPHNTELYSHGTRFGFSYNAKEDLQLGCQYNENGEKRLLYN